MKGLEASQGEVEKLPPVDNLKITLGPKFIESYLSGNIAVDLAQVLLDKGDIKLLKGKDFSFSKHSKQGAA